jgi:hypothetical protein
MAALRKWALVLNVLALLAGFNLLVTTRPLDASSAIFPALVLLAPAFTTLALIFAVASSGSLFEIASRFTALLLDTLLLLAAASLGRPMAKDPLAWVVSGAQIKGSLMTMMGIFLFADAVVSLLALMLGREE